MKKLYLFPAALAGLGLAGAIAMAGDTATSVTREGAILDMECYSIKGTAHTYCINGRYRTGLSIAMIHGGGEAGYFRCWRRTSNANACQRILP